jgi:hypothetical protein
MPIDEMSVVSGAGCEEESWSPEVIALYGDPATINAKMQHLELDLPRRRVFIFTLANRERAELALYERTAPGRVSITSWRGQPSELPHDQIREAIIDNKGVHCVGEQTKVIIQKLSDLKYDSDVPAPANAKAAFSHAVRERGGEYANGTIYLMC